MSSRILKKLNLGRKRHKSAVKTSYKGQNFYFRKSIKPNMPLVVRLHNWGSTYNNYDVLISDKAAEFDWNYIHPNFQGPNNHPDSCASDKAVSDIDHAIEYAISQGNVDKSKIYILGVSGGGHAGLSHFFKSDYKINTYMVWVPITNIEDWYYESLGRGNHYHKDIWAITQSNDTLNVEDARRRSPIFMNTPKDKLKETKLKIYAGVHDGYTGEVPMTHSLKFYNKLAKEFGEEEISQEEILYLLEKRRGKEIEGKIGDRDIHLHKSFKNVEVTIFEGSHEVLGKYAMETLKL